jgi:hypothetical protein
MILRYNMRTLPRSPIISRIADRPCRCPPPIALTTDLMVARCSGGCKFPGSVAEIDGGRYGSVRAWDSFEQGMGGVRKDRLATMRSVVKAMGGLDPLPPCTSLQHAHTAPLANHFSNRRSAMPLSTSHCLARGHWFLRFPPM